MVTGRERRPGKGPVGMCRGGGGERRGWGRRRGGEAGAGRERVLSPGGVNG